MSSTGLSKRIPIYQVDAFASRPFSGNPAAVCLLDATAGPLDDATMQAIATENNLSETAFVEPAEGSAGGPDVFRTASEFRLRWFTPATEVPLCGHATLAAAAVLFSEVGNTSPLISFHTRFSGVLTVARRDPPAAVAASSGATAPALFMEMSMPHLSPDSVPPAGLDLSPGGALACASACGLPVKEVRLAGGAIKYVLVVLEDTVSREELTAMQPDMVALKASAPGGTVCGVIVTAHGGSSGYDVLSRFFGPWLGVPEDPVTGSAHSVLAPYWAARLGKTELTAQQCSARGGELWLKVDSGADRVLVCGQAVTVMSGTFRI